MVSIALLFKWDLNTIGESKLSDINFLLDSKEFKTYLKNKNEKFNLLIKAINNR